MIYFLYLREPQVICQNHRFFSGLRTAAMKLENPLGTGGGLMRRREGRKKHDAFDSRLLFLPACACRRRLWPHQTHDAFGRCRWKVRRFAVLFFPSYCHKKTAANSLSFLIVIAGGVHQICSRFRGKDNGGEMI